MKTFQLAASALFLVASLLAPAGARAGHDGTWHPGDGWHVVRGGGLRIHSVFPIQSIKSLPGEIQDQSRVHGRFVIDFGDVEDDPEISVRGTLRIQDGTSNTALVAESTGSSASCSADLDTGIAGLTELRLLLREPRSGGQLMLLIAPIDGPAPIPGAFEAVFRIGDYVWTEEIAITRAGPPTAVRGGRYA